MQGMQGRVPGSLVFLQVLALSWAARPDPGVWDRRNLTQETNYIGVVKNAYNSTRLDIRITCHTAGDSNFKISVGYALRRTICWEEFLALDSKEAGEQQIYQKFYERPSTNFYPVGEAGEPSYTQDWIKAEFEAVCNEGFVIQPHVSKTTNSPENNAMEESQASSSSFVGSTAVMDKSQGGEDMAGRVRRHIGLMGADSMPVYRLEKEGIYLLVVHVAAVKNTQPFTASVHVEMRAPTGGYLSVTDWPLLPFYGTMCGVYVALGLAWLVVCAMHWRDILRIQFWIGGVIFLGMVEKAMFCAEYQNINNSGEATEGLILAAEVVSCGKRTLARMLVIIVSLGFGIVKPRLGPLLNRVVGTGGLYFLLASAEACLRVVHPKNDPSNKTMMAAIPLAVIDASICWWVFSALIATTRTLRLRRNLVKLSLYRHFTNTLVFAVVASIIFMLWSIKYHKIVNCLTEWKDLWVDEAFWHLLFSCLLCVIMVLWRPSQNNQRYAFMPLLDDGDDCSSDEETLYNDAWDGMKDRRHKNPRPDSPEGADPEEDPLRWVEENIPDMEAALPIIDSEEEIETTKMEISKLM